MKTKFKVVTFNLWKDCGNFPERIYKIPEFLNKLDCICFQEDFQSDHFSSSESINAILKMEKTTLVIRKKNRDGIMSSSNLTILTKEKPKRINRLIFGKDGEDERGALIVELTHNDKNILVLNTHLTNLDHKKRIEQIANLKSYTELEQIDLMILCGDMNATPSSKEIQCIKRDGFVDYNTKPTYQEGLILDYILSKSNFLMDVKSKILVQNLSDHYCLQNKFIW